MKKRLYKERLRYKNRGISARMQNIDIYIRKLQEIRLHQITLDSDQKIHHLCSLIFLDSE